MNLQDARCNNKGNNYCLSRETLETSVCKMLIFAPLKQVIRKVKCFDLTVSYINLSKAYCDVQANFLMVTIRVRHFQAKIFFKFSSF